MPDLYLTLKTVHVFGVLATILPLAAVYVMVVKPV